MMYQCIKRYGSIKTGSFWNVDRYIVNSEGERIKAIITNEDNMLLLSMTEFENHFTQVNELLTEQEYLQTANTEQLADVLYNFFMTRTLCHICPKIVDKECEWCESWCDKKLVVEWLKQPHRDKG